MTGLRPVHPTYAWARRLNLVAGTIYVAMLVTQPWSWLHLGLGLVLLAQALLVPGPRFFQALAEEKERKALEAGEDAT